MSRGSMLRALGALAAALLLAGGCGPSGPPLPEEAQAQPAGPLPPPAYGDALLIGSIGEASNLIPMLASDGASHDVANLVYNGLVKFDKDLKLVGDLAERWDVSPDGLVFTFHLRKGVRWHDGVEFTADDASFTYRFMIDPKTPTPYAGDFEMVKRAEVVDRYTFRVYYGTPFAPALASWGMGIVPKHLLQGADLETTPLKRTPIGTGPFRDVEWVTGQKIVLRANPDYFEGRPFLDRWVYRIIPDLDVMFKELKAGGIDEMGLTPLQFMRQTVDREFRESFRKYRYLAFGYTYLGLNLLDPRFADARVRQAISYAIDKQEIVDGVLLGLGQPAVGPFKPGHWAYNTRLQPFPYDPEKAKRLLAEAGFRDTDGDGIRERGGRPFRFTILTNMGNTQREKVAAIIQYRLRQVGIAVEIQIIEWAAFINEFIDKKKFEAVVLGWSIGQEPDQYDIWHSSRTGRKQLNFISYRNPVVDDLLVRARETFDQAARKRLYDRFQEILHEEQPYVFLYVPEALPVVHARIHGIEPAPAGIAYNLIRWYVPEGRQRHRLVP